MRQGKIVFVGVCLFCCCACSFFFYTQGREAGAGMTLFAEATDEYRETIGLTNLPDIRFIDFLNRNIGNIVYISSFLDMSLWGEDSGRIANMIDIDRFESHSSNYLLPLDGKDAGDNLILKLLMDRNLEQSNGGSGVIQFELTGYFRVSCTYHSGPESRYCLTEFPYVATDKRGVIASAEDLVVSADEAPQTGDAQKRLEQAETTLEMNQAVDDVYAQADAELNRIYTTIREIYAENPLFLEKMKLSQRAWIKLRDADFLMMYPHADEPGYYGSIFGVEATQYRAIQTKQRTAYLRRWLIGVHKEECSIDNRSLGGKGWLKEILRDDYPGGR